MPRYFVEPCDIDGITAVIKGDDAKHLGMVLRAKEGDFVEICDGEGNDYTCVVKDIQKKEIFLGITGITQSVSEPKTDITLFQGLPKSDKMELIIQKCVELGVRYIVPVVTERAIVKIDKKDTLKKRERWQKISNSAAKQSGRGTIPKIGDVITFEEAVSAASAFDGALIPYEKEEKRGLKEFVNNFTGKNICIFIGPEGGFDGKEIEFAEENGVLPITLGKRILRTETAGMVVLSILLYELG